MHLLLHLINTVLSNPRWIILFLKVIELFKIVDFVLQLFVDHNGLFQLVVDPSHIHRVLKFVEILKDLFTLFLLLEDELLVLV